jgi:hypothetical protein
MEDHSYDEKMVAGIAAYLGHEICPGGGGAIDKADGAIRHGQASGSGQVVDGILGAGGGEGE